MALRIRLARSGSKKRPYYRIVVAENTSPRDGRFIEKVGTYNPLLPHEHQDRLRLAEDRIKHWLSVGAQPTDRVARFLGQNNLIAMPAINESPKKSMPKQKAQERAKEKAEKLAAAEAQTAATAEAETQETSSVEAPVEEVRPEENPIEEAAAPEPEETAAIATEVNSAEPASGS